MRLPDLQDLAAVAFMLLLFALGVVLVAIMARFAFWPETMINDRGGCRCRAIERE